MNLKPCFPKRKAHCLLQSKRFNFPELEIKWHVSITYDKVYIYLILLTISFSANKPNFEPSELSRSALLPVEVRRKSQENFLIPIFF